MSESREPNGRWEDPIVAEVRAVRAELFAASGSDIRTFCRRLRAEQARSGHVIVTRGGEPGEPRSEPRPSTSRGAG